MSAGGAEARAGRAIVVRIRGERHALPAEAVEEIVDAPVLVPLAPLGGHVAGLLRHREGWIPVIDPAPLLSLDGTVDPGIALLVRRGGARVALLADDVAGMVELGGSAVLRGARSGADATVVMDEAGPIALLLPETLFRATLSGGGEGMAQETHGSARAAIVAFRIGNTELGVPVAQVVEVAPAASLRIDGAEDAAHLAGHLGREDGEIPVLDLRRLLRAASGGGDVVLVLRAAGREFGVLADQVSDVVHLDAGDIAELPAFLAGAIADFVTGLARTGERMLSLVDAGALLSPDAWARVEARAPAGRKDAAADAARPTRP